MCLLVSAPANKIIRLDFRDYFEIEESSNCDNDFLEVRDGMHGYNTLLEKKFCGINEFPPIIQSSDRYLWIHFKSDENIEYRGFRAVFEYVDRPPGCKYGVIDDESLVLIRKTSRFANRKLETVIVELVFFPLKRLRD